MYKLLAVVLFFSFDAAAQNLLRDPGFEMVSRILDGSDTVYQYRHWHSLLSLKKLSFEGRPLLSVYAKRRPYDRFLNHWIPYEGDSYMFSHWVYLRNLYQTELINPLKRDQVYKINFKYKILSNGFLKKKREEAINGKIGGMFATKDLSDSIGIATLKNLKMKVHPQFAVDSFTGDSIGQWMDFTYYYKAEKPYRYFIIGNFEKLIESYELKNEPITGIGYRIDNVSVESVEENEIIKQLIKDQNKPKK